MRTKIGWFTFLNFSRFTQSVVRQINRKGQALVEFTLCFILLVAIAWIPADFGLLFYTGQLTQNAAREGARIASADPTLTVGTQSCTLPCSSGAEILQRVSDRISAGITKGSTLTLTLDPKGAGCTNQNVTVTVQGDYTFWFYKLLRLMGATTPNAVTITRSTHMRWEHQC
jgi:Flp pilus assembly protein TadG